MLTEEEAIKTIETLSDRAINTYLDRTNFEMKEWLDKEDLEELEEAEKLFDSE